LDLIRRDPRTLGEPRTRWRLCDLGPHCAWLADHSVSGTGRVLRRLGIRYKRGRDAVVSPDVEYQAKRQALAAIAEQVKQTPDRLVLLFGDEVTIYRQPTLARAYEAVGQQVQPLARLSYRRNVAERVLGVVDAQSGRVQVTRVRSVTIAVLVQFFRDIVKAYPMAERIYLVLDNWPLHVHPDVLVALEPQQSPFAYHRPTHWPTSASPTAQKRVGDLALPIQLLLLPSYASWLNPIEKLWRKLRQDVLHLHRLADDDAERRQAVGDFFAQFADGSAPLLHEIGLAPDPN
jgi:transposase